MRAETIWCTGRMVQRNANIIQSHRSVHLLKIASQLKMEVGTRDELFILQVIFSMNICKNFFYITYSLALICLDDIEEAKQIKEKRRNMAPPVYSPARLKEKPVPRLVVVPDDESSAESANTNEVDPLNLQPESATTDDQAIASASMSDTNINDEFAGLSLVTSCEIKTEPPTFNELDTADANAAEQLLDDSYENCYDDDDDVLIFKEATIPIPIQSRYELKKNDILSKNIPFATDVNL